MSKHLTLALLTLLPAAAVHAAPPAAVKKPVPPLVQKFIATVQNAQTLSVDAVQVVPPGSIAESAHIVIARPNKVRVAARVGNQFVSNLVIDGTTLYQWDNRGFVKQKAPSLLADYNAGMSLGLFADSVFFPLMSPAQFMTVMLFKDKGAVYLHGIPVRKMVYQATSSTISFWLAQSNGLPLQMTIDLPTSTLTVAFGT